MTTTQLRRYDIEPGRMDDFLAWWQSILGPRQQYGFRVAFAHADDENSQFVWAVEHDGDFDAAETEYMASPERAEAFDTNPNVVTKHVVSKVRVIRP
jgi:antibiotic biosynthesis monooxygenase (ABM) superfamily enzyme